MRFAPMRSHERASVRPSHQNISCYFYINTQMTTITLTDVLPHVFAQRTDLRSDVWQQRISFEKGKTYLVEAMSGTGKSTLCSYILGYRHDYTGTLRFDDTDVRTYRIGQWAEIRQRHISHLFQELRLFPELTALQNVEIKNNIARFKSREQIEAWFERLGIADKLHAKVGQMSFGQQQRVAMVRALVQPFDFLLVDEPISHLDDTNSAVMADIMMAEARAQHAGVIVTSIGKHMQIPYDAVLRL